MKKIFFLVIAAIFLASCGSSAQPINIINPDAEYRYFFGASCPHCQQLNRDATEIDLYSRISIEKREVYGNEENRQMFLDLIAELGIDDSGVPFVYDTVTGKVAVGVKPAFELMTSRLGKSGGTQEEGSKDIGTNVNPENTLLEDTFPEEKTEESSTLSGAQQ